jgi:hypothetical protein
MRAGRRTDMTKLIVDFRNFAKAAKINTYTNNSGTGLTNSIGVTIRKAADDRALAEIPICLAYTIYSYDKFQSSHESFKIDICSTPIRTRRRNYVEPMPQFG